MLNAMRGNRKFLTAVLWIVIFAFLSTIFVVWGLGPNETHGNYVASIDGEKLSYERYQVFYDNTINTYRESLGDDFNDYAATTDLNNQILNEFINRYLLIEEAKRLNIVASDLEVINSVISVPSFQLDGVFDPETYQHALAYNRITPAQFEESVRDDIYLQKIRNIVLSAGSVITEKEMKMEYSARASLRDISYIAIPINRFFDPNTLKDNNSGAENFFMQNKENYRTDREIKLKYTIFDENNYVPEEKIVISDQDIETRYARDISQYTINANISDNDNNSKIEIPQSKREEITNELTAERRVSLYRSHILNRYREILDSGNITAYIKDGKGADLKIYETALFNEDNVELEALMLLPNIKTSIFALPKSEISQLVEYDNDIYIFEILDSNDSVIPAFSDVSSVVIADYINDKSFQNASDTLTKELDNQTLTEIAKKYNVKIDKVDGMNADIESIFSTNFALMDDILRAKEGDIIDYIYFVDNDAFIVQIDKKHTPADKEYSYEKDEIRAYLQSIKSVEALNAYVGSLRVTRDVEINSTSLNAAHNQ